MLLFSTTTLFDADELLEDVTSGLPRLLLLLRSSLTSLSCSWGPAALGCRPARQVPSPCPTEFVSLLSRQALLDVRNHGVNAGGERLNLRRNVL